MQAPHVAENISKDRYAITTGAEIETNPYFMKAIIDTTMIKIRQELRT
jgi:hypothetical protein